LSRIIVVASRDQEDEDMSEVTGERIQWRERTEMERLEQIRI
jgi:hypothetical protein